MASVGQLAQLAVTALASLLPCLLVRLHLPVPWKGQKGCCLRRLCVHPPFPGGFYELRMAVQPDWMLLGHSLRLPDALGCCGHAGLARAVLPAAWAWAGRCHPSRRGCAAGQRCCPSPWDRLCRAERYLWQPCSLQACCSSHLLQPSPAACLERSRHVCDLAPDDEGCHRHAGALIW